MSDRLTVPLSHLLCKDSAVIMLTSWCFVVSDDGFTYPRERDDKSFERQMRRKGLGCHKVYGNNQEMYLFVLRPKKDSDLIQCIKGLPIGTLDRVQCPTALTDKVKRQLVSLLPLSNPPRRLVGPNSFIRTTRVVKEKNKTANNNNNNNNNNEDQPDNEEADIVVAGMQHLVRQGLHPQPSYYPQYQPSTVQNHVMIGPYTHHIDAYSQEPNEFVVNFIEPPTPVQPLVPQPTPYFPEYTQYNQTYQDAPHHALGQDTDGYQSCIDILGPTIRSQDLDKLPDSNYNS